MPADVVVADRVLDFGLNELDANCDRVYVCTAEPTTFTEATSTFSLGFKSATAGSIFGAPANGSPDGRQVSSSALTGGAISTSGTPARWAAVDFANSRLLAQGKMNGAIAMTAGQAFSLGAITVKLPAS